MVNLKLNVVYDYWDADVPIDNGKFHYPNSFFWNLGEFVYHYINSFVFYNKIEIVSHKIEDVYNNPNVKFYYFICHANLCISDLINDGKLMTNQLKKHIKNCPNLNVVFHSHHESDSYLGFTTLLKFLNDENFNHNQFHVYNNNALLDTLKRNHKTNINVHSYNYLPVSVTSSLPNLGGNEFKENKKFFFMTFNKSPKIHRYSLLMFLRKNKLLGDTNWSFIPQYRPNFTINDFTKIFSNEEVTDYTEELNYFNNLKIKISEYESDYLIFDENNNFIIKDSSRNLGLNPEFSFNYTESYINITTESAWGFENTIQITEKSFKPFFYYQIPIFLTTCNHVKILRERYDFDLFDDVVNHNYDSEPDDKTRFKMVCEEIMRLFNNKDSIIDFYKNNKSRFDNNRNKILTINKNNSDYFLFKNLI